MRLAIVFGEGMSSLGHDLGMSGANMKPGLYADDVNSPRV